jgi:hypothetical protein
MTEERSNTIRDEAEASERAQTLAKVLYSKLTNSGAFVRFWASSRRPNTSPDYDGPRVVSRYRKNVAGYVKIYHEAADLTKKDP